VEVGPLKLLWWRQTLQEWQTARGKPPAVAFTVAVAVTVAAVFVSLLLDGRAIIFFLEVL
jgi:hypothetical protein